jgi:ATP-dependent DNA helicase RecG
MIKDFDINTIILKGENETTEFKTSFNKEVIETLVAFANKNGGSVFIGISKNNAVVGVNLNAESVQNWINEIKSKTTPVLIPDYNIYTLNNKSIVEIKAGSYPLKPVATQGRYLKRVGNSNHLLSVNEVSDMHLRCINSSWDAFPDPLHTINDISIEKVQNVIAKLRKKGKNIDSDIPTFLSKYNLLRDDKLTFAAYLMFKKDDCFLSTIELGHFQDEITIKDSDRTKSDLITQVEEVFDFVRKHINKAIVITGEPQNTEKWDYPLEAIREIIMNMIVHRDYRSSADSVLKIFEHKIEFFNPGSLPDDITVDDLLNNTYISNPRNKLIADLFKDLGHIEKYGSGIKRIISLFENENLPVPEFKNISGGFLVTVFNDKSFNDNDLIDDTENYTENYTKNYTKNYTERKILLAIKNNPKITIVELAQLIELTEIGIKWNIKNLKQKGFLQRVGHAKGGYWKIISNNKPI